MSYFFIGIIILSAIITLKAEPNKKYRQIIGIIYASIVVLIFAYSSGENIGKALYFYKNNVENVQEK